MVKRRKRWTYGLLTSTEVRELLLEAIAHGTSDAIEPSASPCAARCCVATRSRERDEAE
jgi:hypothetical protein